MQSSNSDVVKEAFGLLCRTVGTPYAIQAYSRFIASEASLEQLEMPQPESYPSAHPFLQDYYVYSYIRKYVGLDVDQSLIEDESYAKWYAYEESCRQTNQRIKAGDYSPSFRAVLDRAKETIAKVLGTFSYHKVLVGCDIGPGASSGIPRSLSPSGRKHLLPLTTTYPCRKAAAAWCEIDYHISSVGLHAAMLLPFERNFTVVPGGELGLVPKTSFVHRVIDKQPSWNIWFQKGAGHYMRGRLKKFGVDLDSQTRNRQCAAIAHKAGYATLDLSGASDCKAKLLIKALLNENWYDWLERIRTTVTTYIRKEYGIREVIPLEKFSSMGNGFTFELETLVFWALLGPENVVSIFGDDIVVRKDFYATAVAILTEAGFTVNSNKSYAAGPFYESCGGHFFEGHEVTPVYQKERVEELIHYVRAANRWYKASVRAHGIFLPDSLEGVMYEYFVEAARERYGDDLPFVPNPKDDRGFISHERRGLRKYDPNRGYLCRILVLSKGKGRRGFSSGLYWRKLWDPAVSSPLDLRGLYREHCGEGGCKLSYRWISTQ